MLVRWCCLGGARLAMAFAVGFASWDIAFLFSCILVPEDTHVSFFVALTCIVSSLVVCSCVVVASVIGRGI